MTKKKVYFILFSCLIIMLGCGKNNDLTDSNYNSDLPSVALLMNGPMSDMGWNSSAYNGIKQIEEKYGVKVAYKENSPQSDYEANLRAFASYGFEVIYSHGAEFTDSVLATAKDFPDVQFIIINGEVGRDNVASVYVSDEQQGYVMGAVAAVITQTEEVGIIGGLDVPPIRLALEAYKKVAVDVGKQLGKKVKTLDAWTGNYEDVARVKEISMSFADNGADVVAAVANQASLGAVEAAEAKGIYAVGAGVDQQEVGPNSVVVSVIKDVSVGYTYAYDLIAAGDFDSEIYKVGVKEGVVTLSDWNPSFDKIVTPEKKLIVTEVMEKMANGEININD